MVGTVIWVGVGGVVGCVLYCLGFCRGGFCLKVCDVLGTGSCSLVLCFLKSNLVAGEQKLRSVPIGSSPKNTSNNNRRELTK